MKPKLVGLLIIAVALASSPGLAQGNTAQLKMVKCQETSQANKAEYVEKCRAGLVRRALAEPKNAPPEAR